MIKVLTNRWFHMALLFFLLLAAVYYSGSKHDLRTRLQYATFDTFNKILPRPATDQVVIVDLDEESIKELGQWPWPRTTMAKLVDQLHAMGAKVIAFDIVFAESDRTSPVKISENLPDDPIYDSVRAGLKTLPDNDTQFANSIQNAGNVVMGFTRARREETQRKPYQPMQPTFLLKDKTELLDNSFAVSGIAENLEIFSKAAAGNGSFMATPDIDGLIRQVSLLVKFPSEKTLGFEPELYPMLALEALRVYVDPKSKLIVRQNKAQGLFDKAYSLQLGEYQVPIENNGKMWVYYRSIDRSEYVPAHRFFKSDAYEQLKQKIEGKIVFIGTSAEGLRDIRSTPLNIFVPGVEVHVNVVEQILQGKFLSRPDIIVGFEAAIILIAGLIIIVLVPFVNVLWLALFTASLTAGLFIGSWEAYKNIGLLLDPVYPAIALGFLFMASSLLSYLRSEIERRHVRQAFGLYISPTFMEELTKNPDKLKLGGEVRDLTVMFTDIRSFTAISERLSPEELIQLMNDFLTPMSDLVMQNRGTIDKYMGDAMMAFWNAPLDDPDHARHACITALKMNEALIPVNERITAKAAEQGKTPILLSAGIGINTGPCSVGNMGSRQRFAYSALGDAVNLASRLESQTKFYGVNILLGENTARSLNDMAILEVDLIKVKGKEKPAHVYTLLGDDGYALNPDFIELKKHHIQLIQAYRALDLALAKNMLDVLRPIADPRLSGLYGLYEERITTLTQTPPPDDWGGVYVAKDK
jgi:adenylate cyclase